MDEPLSEKDLQSLMDCVRDLYTVADIGGFPLRVMSCLARLVEADSYAYDEANPAKGRALGIMQPPEMLPPADRITLFKGLLDTHPLFRHWMGIESREGIGGGAIAISDLVDRDKWQQVPIYAQFYRGEGVEDQLGLMIDFPRPVVVAVACNRANWGFTRREKRLLNLLHPHIIQAYKNAEAVAELAERGEGGSALRRGVVLFSRDGEMMWETGGVHEWVADYVPRSIESLKTWAQSIGLERAAGDTIAERRKVKRIRGQSGWLTMRLVEGADGGAVVILEEHGRSRHDVSRVGQSMAAGMPERMQQVLEGLLSGQNAKQISAHLQLSVHTVREHIQRVYERFGVSGRGELLAFFVRKR